MVQHWTMSSPHPGTREYRNQTVRITDLTVTDDLLADLRFENCTIIGPAVLALIDDVVLSNCGFDAPGADAVFWPVAPNRQIVIGAIGLVRVEFYSCRFMRIGIAAIEDTLPELLKGFNEVDS